MTSSRCYSHTPPGERKDARSREVASGRLRKVRAECPRYTVVMSYMYLEDFCYSVEQLPQEMKGMLSNLRTLDLKVQGKDGGGHVIPGRLGAVNKTKFGVASVQVWCAPFEKHQQACSPLANLSVRKPCRVESSA